MSKIPFTSYLIDFFIKSTRLAIETKIINPQDVNSITERFDLIIFDTTNFAGDITEILECLEVMVPKTRKRIVLLNSDRVFYRNKGYTLFPNAGKLESFDKLLQMGPCCNKDEFRMKKDIMEILEREIKDPRLTAIKTMTQKQKAVFKLLLSGITYEQIAYELDITLNTAKARIRRIYKALEISSRNQLLVDFGYLMEDSETPSQGQKIATV